jgi:lipoprotein NlpD
MKEWHWMMFREVFRLGFSALTLLALAACTSSPRAPAPVETRGSSPKVSAQTVAPSAETVKAIPGSENAGKPGFYTVQRGDTLTRIALDHGHSWRDLASWNSLPNAHLIEVGQVLRVASPTATVEASGVVVQPMGGSAEVGTAAKPAAAPTPAPSANDEGLGFAWPASGSVIGGFDEAKNKGLDIGGKAGDPVLAAADGQVVYAGAGLRGYGNLIILKHNNTFLTAYAHNQALMVKEDQKVRKGQKIAEMGKTDADRVKLHFEIRRQGKPVDPAKYLPVR